MVDNKVLAGKIVSTHALRGEVKVYAFGARDWPVDVVSARVKDGPRELHVRKVRPSKGTFIVDFKEISSIDEAESLLGCDLFVERDALPEPTGGEYYHADLIGMRVETTEGREVGIFKEVLETGATDVFSILTLAGEDLLIPAREDFIDEIDVKGKRIVVKNIDLLTLEDGGSGNGDEPG